MEGGEKEVSKNKVGIHPKQIVQLIELADMGVGYLEDLTQYVM